MQWRDVIVPACLVCALVTYPLAKTAKADDGGGGNIQAHGVCGLGTGRPATGEPIKIGSINTKVPGIDYTSIGRMAGACFQCVNDNGGINGRPVQFIMEEETQVDPQQIAALANKLVEEDGVLGIVGSTAINDCNVNEEFYENEGLFPIIAGVDLKCFQSPQFSSINMGPYYSNLGGAQGAVSAGAKGMLVVVSPEQLGDSNSGTVEFAQSMGLKTVSLLEDVPLAEPEELAEKLVQTARPGRRRGARFYRLDGPAIAPGNSEEASHRRRSLGELNSRL